MSEMVGETVRKVRENKRMRGFFFFFLLIQNLAIKLENFTQYH